MGKFAKNYLKPIVIPIVQIDKTTWGLPGVINICISANGNRKEESQNAGLAATEATKTQKQDTQKSTLAPGKNPLAKLKSKENLMNAEQKQRLVQNHLSALIHAVFCDVRDKLVQHTGIYVQPCALTSCLRMKAILYHMKTCHARKACPIKYCYSSCCVLSHWKSCKSPLCRQCSNLVKPAQKALLKLNGYLPWKNEILKRFLWLYAFVGASCPLLNGPLHQQQQGKQDEQEQQQNSASNFERGLFPGSACTVERLN